jgi:hypothetical protein
MPAQIWTVSDLTVIGLRPAQADIALSQNALFCPRPGGGL